MSDINKQKEIYEKLGNLGKDFDNLSGIATICNATKWTKQECYFFKIKSLMINKNFPFIKTMEHIVSTLRLLKSRMIFYIYGDNGYINIYI